jgi:hypothetical protein
MTFYDKEPLAPYANTVCFAYIYIPLWKFYLIYPFLDIPKSPVATPRTAPFSLYKIYAPGVPEKISTPIYWAFSPIHLVSWLNEMI